jgi:cytochrome c oxidase cbb3-type subunit IV
MNFVLLSSIITVVSLLTFVGILYWAFNRRNKERFEALGRLPIDNDNGTTGN